MRTFKFCFLILAVWCASVGLAEMGFRLLGDRPSNDLGGMYTPFGDGSYKLAPSIDTDANWSTGKLFVHTDPLGLRCDKGRQRGVSSNGRLDMLLLGDSQGFGNGVNYEDSLAGAFAVLAATSGRQVANASVGGHALLNQIELAQWLDRIHSVEVSHYVALLTPVMIRNGAGYARSVVGDDGRLYTRQLGPREKAQLWAKSHTTVYSRIRDAIRNSGIGTTPNAAAPFVLQIYSSAHASESESNLVASLQRLQERAAQRGARVSLVYVPLTVEIDSAALHKAAAANGIALDLEAPYRICSSAAARLGLPLHSLRPVLARFHQEGRALNLGADFHYNPDLSRACATSLWSQVQNAAASQVVPGLN